MAIQSAKPQILSKIKRPGCKSVFDLTERSGEVFFLDILSHRMSEIGIFCQLRAGYLFEFSAIESEIVN
jgi:hypothetical protein